MNNTVDRDRLAASLHWYAANPTDVTFGDLIAPLMTCRAHAIDLAEQTVHMWADVSVRHLEFHAGARPVDARPHFDHEPDEPTARELAFMTAYRMYAAAVSGDREHVIALAMAAGNAGGHHLALLVVALADGFATATRDYLACTTGAHRS
jgi:hypothetical protein